MNPDIRIGYGEDSHRLEKGRPLILAGLNIPDSPHGSVAHSDGDALLHAVSDALLSSLALGDIGHYFPDTAIENKNLDSAIILRDALARVQAAGYALINVVAVVRLDKPKLGPHREEIQERLAKLLLLEKDCVGIGFKTSEGLAPNHVQTTATILLGKVN